MVRETTRASSRRDFLEFTSRLLGALAVGEVTYLAIRFLASRKAGTIVEQIVSVGMPSDFSPGSISPFEAAHAYIVRFEDGGFLALRSTCTHLACVVGWQRQQGHFACPCHGSVFNRDGSVASPPAPRPLDRYEIVFADDGHLLVKTGRPIARAAVGSGDVVYPSEPVAPTATPFISGVSRWFNAPMQAVLAWFKR